MLNKIVILPLIFATNMVLANVSQFKLDNGLKLIVKEVHRAPVVINSIWYKVGSADEYNGITGISHMLEHMLFKGTTKYPKGVFSEIISKNGGKLNAFTSYDYTGYYEILPKEKIEIAIKLEADRMTNIVFDENEFLKERKVVQEERRLRIEDNPNSQLTEQLKYQAFASSPYHHPIIGWMQDIQEYTKEDAKKWYEKWYAPNNAIVVIVGDVNAEQIYQSVKKYFGKYSSKSIKKTKKQLEIQQKGLRYSQFITKRKLPPRVIMAYHVPSLKTADNKDDAYALDILSFWQNRVLSKEFVRKKQLLTSINTQYSMFSKLNTLYYFDFIPVKEFSIKDAKKEVLRKIQSFKKKLITKKELQIILAQIESFFIYSQDEISTQSTNIGLLESIGLDSQTIIDTYLSNIAKITPEKIKEVANKYLANSKLNVVELKPKK